MMTMGAGLFLPAHGLPITGRDRIAAVLNDVADQPAFLSVVAMPRT
jgi:hypothetical protein